MLKHRKINPSRPERIVILGANGFVGGAVVQAFKAENTETLALNRTRLDLLNKNASIELVNLLKTTDTCVVISAEAPCKDAEMLIRNIRIMDAICAAIKLKQPEHVIYVSSDAVYRDSAKPLDESSCAQPGSIHGSMHLTREIMLKEAVEQTLAILRPTLIYGVNDPHNGYGPNRFRRLAEAGQEIVLFGKGEERRDHVIVGDVAELVRLIAWHKSKGVLNAASGTVISFREIAQIIVELSKHDINIGYTTRLGDMPHNGYRSFNPMATKISFPDFKYTPIKVGLTKKAQ